MYGERRRVYLEKLTPAVFDRLLAREGTMTVVVHDRRAHQLAPPMLESLRR